MKSKLGDFLSESKVKEAFQKLEEYKVQVFGNSSMKVRPTELNRKISINSISLSSSNEDPPFFTQRNMELRKLLQEFEKWKVQYKDTLSQLGKRELQLKLSPPPHVKDAVVWKEMIQMFPLVSARQKSQNYHLLFFLSFMLNTFLKQTIIITHRV